MKQRIVLFLVLAACSVCTPGCKKSEEAQSSAASEPDITPLLASNEAAELKLKWPPGNRRVYRLDVIQETERPVPWFHLPLKHVIRLGVEYAQTTTTDREAGVDFSVVEFGLTEHRTARMEFDSQQNPAEEDRKPFTPAFRKWAGAKLRARLAADQSVERIEDLQPLLNAIWTTSYAPSRPLDQGCLREIFYRQLFSPGAWLPDKSVKPGASWTAPVELDLGLLGTLVTRADCVFKGWVEHEQRKCAQIEFTGPITTRPSPETLPREMIARLGNGEASGTLWFDPQSGAVVDFNLIQKLAISFTIPPDAIDVGTGLFEVGVQTSAFTQTINLKLREPVPATK